MFSIFQNNKSLLDKETQAAVVAAIAMAERLSSGEIRVYVESRCKTESPIARCEEIFVELKMHETKARNGVLLYLALKDRKFGIVGDEGINQKVGGNDYWQQLATGLQAHLKDGEIKQGICNCVTAIGNKLYEHFPADNSENINELPDEIVFGK